MKTGKELLIQAAKNELKRLSAIAERAKKECDEHIKAPDVMLACHKELAEIISTNKHDKATMQKIENLDGRYKQAVKVSKKDFVKLLDRQFDAEEMRDDLATEIANLEFRFGMLGKRKNES